jgi:hypothetical protein
VKGLRDALGLPKTLYDDAVRRQEKEADAEPPLEGGEFDDFHDQVADGEEKQ